MTRTTLSSVVAAVSIAALPLFGLAGSGHHDKNQTQKAQQQQQAKWLFVQRAQKASLKALPNQQGKYKLVLKNVDSNTIAFTDRPHRKTATIKTKKLIKTWSQGKDSFEQEAPNAAIEFVSFKAKSAGMHTSVFKIVKQPSYDQRAKTMTYTVKPLHQYGVKTGEYHNVAIFIDGKTASAIASAFLDAGAVILAPLGF